VVRTPSATNDDWTGLFDGQRTAGLRAYGGDDFPADHWRIGGGRLSAIPGPGVDLVTNETFADFELEFLWAVASGGNGGVIYRVIESDQPSWASGPEYQILDDAAHADGVDPVTSAGAVYDLLAPGAGKRLASVGEDNIGRIVVRDGSVEHWLNGDLIVAYEWAGPDVRAKIAASKFRDLPDFMAAETGHVVLQHHGEEVSFGSIRIRPL